MAIRTDHGPPTECAVDALAEISLAHLKSCLVNLPATLESLLVNLNTVRSSRLLVDLRVPAPAMDCDLDCD